MYINVTRDLFLQQKFRYFRAVLGIAFLIVVYMFLNGGSTSGVAQTAVPEQMLMTEVIDPYKFVYLKDLSADFIRKLSTRLQDQGRVVPITQRFMFNMMNPLMGDYRFQLLGVPQSFLEMDLNGLIISGRPPRPDELGAVLGNAAAEQMQLKLGDQFEITLDKDANIDNRTYVVTGILNPDAYVYFDRAVFLATESFETAVGAPVAANTLFVYGDGLNSDAFDALLFGTEGHEAIANVSSLKERGFQQLLQWVSGAFLILLSCLTVFQSLEGMLAKSARLIGLLKALGMNDLHVATIFVQGILSIFFVALVSGLGLSWVLFTVLNYQISNMLKVETHLYKLQPTSVWSLLIVLVVTLTVVTLTILYRTRRVPPRKVMLEL